MGNQFTRSLARSLVAGSALACGAHAQDFDNPESSYHMADGIIGPHDVPLDDQLSRHPHGGQVRGPPLEGDHLRDHRRVEEAMAMMHHPEGEAGHHAEQRRRRMHGHDEIMDKHIPREHPRRLEETVRRVDPEFKQEADAKRRVLQDELRVALDMDNEHHADAMRHELRNLAEVVEDYNRQDQNEQERRRRLEEDDAMAAELARARAEIDYEDAADNMPPHESEIGRPARPGDLEL